MLQPFTCAIVCPPPFERPPEADPFNDGFSFRHAQNMARKCAEAALQLAQTAAAQADLVVLPEDLHGVRHFWRMADAPQMLRRLAEPVPGPTTKTAGRIARRNKAHLVVNLYENHGNTVYNTTVLIGRRGKLLARYRKTHLAPGEDWLVSPGAGFSVVKTRLGRIGLVCGEDYLFPETACIMTRLNTEILICPSRYPVPDILLSSRSFEGAFFTIFAQPDGSLLIDQTGSALAQSAGRRPLILATDFEPRPAWDSDRAELEHILTGMTDGRQRRSCYRRPEVYGLLAKRKWPEGARLSHAQKEGKKWEAHSHLTGAWEEGPAYLPQWEV